MILLILYIAQYSESRSHSLLSQGESVTAGTTFPASPLGSQKYLGSCVYHLGLSKFSLVFDFGSQLWQFICKIKEEGSVILAPFHVPDHIHSLSYFTQDETTGAAEAKLSTTELRNPQGWYI